MNTHTFIDSDATVLRRGTLSDSRYTTVANAIARGQVIPIEYVGVWTWLASHRDGWQLSERRVAAAIGKGRGYTASALAAIEDAGLLYREQGRDAHGRVTGGTWYITDLPVTLAAQGLSPAEIRAHVDADRAATLGTTMPLDIDTSPQVTPWPDKPATGQPATDDQATKKNIPSESDREQPPPTPRPRTVDRDPGHVVVRARTGKGITSNSSNRSRRRRATGPIPTRADAPTPGTAPGTASMSAVDRARRFLADVAVPAGAAPLTAAQVDRLLPLVLAAWRAGQSNATLRGVLTANPHGMRSAAAVWHTRLTRHLADLTPAPADASPAASPAAAQAAGRASAGRSGFVPVTAADSAGRVAARVLAAQAARRASRRATRPIGADADHVAAA